MSLAHFSKVFIIFPQDYALIYIRNINLLSLIYIQDFLLVCYLPSDFAYGMVLLAKKFFSSFLACNFFFYCSLNMNHRKIPTNTKVIK